MLGHHSGDVRHERCSCRSGRSRFRPAATTNRRLLDLGNPHCPVAGIARHSRSARGTRASRGVGRRWWDSRGELPHQGGVVAHGPVRDARAVLEADPAGHRYQMLRTGRRTRRMLSDRHADLCHDVRRKAHRTVGGAGAPPSAAPCWASPAASHSSPPSAVTRRRSRRCGSLLAAVPATVLVVAALTTIPAPPRRPPPRRGDPPSRTSLTLRTDRGERSDGAATCVAWGHRPAAPIHRQTAAWSIVVVAWVP